MTAAAAATITAIFAAALFSAAAAAAYHRHNEDLRRAAADEADAMRAEIMRLAGMVEQAAETIDVLGAIIARQHQQAEPGAGDAIARLTAENEQLRHRARVAMLEAIDANLAAYAIRNPGLLRPTAPGSN